MAGRVNNWEGGGCVEDWAGDGLVEDWIDGGWEKHLHVSLIYPLKCHLLRRAAL